MPKVFTGIGSNLGDRAGYFDQAQKELATIPGIRNICMSPVYETEPIDADGGLFLNAAWSFETEMSAQKLLGQLQRLESQAGRERKTVNGARTLDLDLLFYGNQVSRGLGLVVPHPRLHERAFVLAPLCDLEPGFIHPVLKRTVRELLQSLGGKMPHSTCNSKK